MTFEQVLKDIENLVGRELSSINPNTGSIQLVQIDRDQQSYVVKPSKGNKVTRRFSELQKIWDQLVLHSAANVEVVLEGSGSSRNQPETVLANLPYIDYFKFNKKKHLYLQKTNTHELGSINQLSASAQKEVKRILNSQYSFDRRNFSERFGKALATLKDSLEEVSVKYPGELRSSSLVPSMDELDTLLKIIEGTIIRPSQDYSEGFDISNMDDLDSPEFTGYDDGQVDRGDGGDEEAGTNEVQQVKELSNARIRYQTPAFSLVFDRMKHEEIELQPNFQRRDRIWRLKEKSALVESILIGLPIPNLYFAERSNGNWVIVDGLQRLTTLKDFMEGKFKLSELTILGDLENKKFTDLERQHQRKFREYTLHCHIISMQGDDDVMVKELFHRINTYGVTLSYQEIRCALYAGSSVSFIRYIAESESFANTTFDKISSKRMKDMEFVLGAVAFVLFGYKGYAYNRFDEFLGKAMKNLNRFKINIEGDFLSSQEEENNPIPPRWHDKGGQPPIFGPAYS